MHVQHPVSSRKPKWAECKVSVSSTTAARKEKERKSEMRNRIESQLILFPRHYLRYLSFQRVRLFRFSLSSWQAFLCVWNFRDASCRRESSNSSMCIAPATTHHFHRTTSCTYFINFTSTSNVSHVAFPFVIARRFVSHNLRIRVQNNRQ